MTEDSLSSKLSPIPLEQAFKQFSLETERLESVYTTLQHQFKVVQEDLQKTNTRLYAQLAELNFVTSYLEAILNHMSQGIVFVDFTGIITTCNQMAEEILQIKKDEVLFHPIWEVLSDEVFGFSLKQALQQRECPKTLFMTRSLTDGKKQELEVETTFVSLSAQVCPVSLAFPSQQLPQGLLILIRNITELRRLQQEASRHDRLKALGEMAARVAHEIRNPLGGIKGFAALLKEDLKDRPDLQQMANQIIEGTDGLNRLVSNVLNYSRPFQPHFEMTNVTEFIQEMVELMRVDSSQKGPITYLFQAPSEPIIAPLDVHLFKSALLNLFVNARQAMPEGGTLTVELEKTDHEAFIKVRDSGVGIAEENMDKLFSPFFTTKELGNGFGLSETHKVIQTHHGSIEVQSTAGKGTVFTIRIPLKFL